jgi:transposase
MEKPKRSLGRSELAKLYQVSMKTFNKWVAELVPKGKKILSPDEVGRIYAKLGVPEPY